jgi:hypothetical protein
LAPHPDRAAKSFLENSLKYNTNLALASVQTQREPRAPGYRPTGKPVCKINGVLSFHACDLRSAPHRTPAFAQIYTLEPEKAMEKRMENEYTRRLQEAVLRNLDASLRLNNPYVKVYKTAHEMLKEAEEESQRTGTPIPNFQLLLLSNSQAAEAEINRPDIHAHRTETPSGSEQVSINLFSQSLSLVDCSDLAR